LANNNSIKKLSKERDWTAVGSIFFCFEPD